jgi:ABC-type Fe3+ transport system substrate-binding protein
MKHLMRFAAAVCALLGAAASPAFAQDALVEAARKEGQVTWYTSLIQNQGAMPIAAAFERKYPGIKVNLVAGTNDSLLVKLLNEGRAKSMQADVSHGGGSVSPLRAADLLAKYTPTLPASFPAAYRDPEGYWVAETVYFLGASINTTLVAEKDVPRTLDDLLAPKWRGKIAFMSQLTQGGPPGLIGAVLARRGPEKGKAFLEALSQQKIVNVPGNQRVVIDQVIAGEYPIALMTFNHHAALSAAQGAPVRWIGLEPAVGNIDALFLLKDAPHPNAGKLFIDFLLSADGQAIMRDAGYIPTDPATAAKIPALKPEVGKFEFVMITPKMVQDNMESWIASYNRLFK